MDKTVLENQKKQSVINFGDRSFVITTNTLIVGIFLLGLIWFILRIKFIVISLFVSIILALALEPLVQWQLKRKIPKVFAVVSTVISVLVLLIVMSIVAITPMVNQTKQLWNNLPSILESYSKVPEFNSYVQNIKTDLQNVDVNSTKGSINFIFGAVSNISGGALAVFGNIMTILFFTVYILLDFENFRGLLINLFPPKQRKLVGVIIKEIEVKLGNWIRGEAILMFAVGLLTYIGLNIIQYFIGNVPYLESIALIAGLFEVIPIIGPIFASIVGVFIGFSSSPLIGISILILFIIVQQSENSILVPKVMEKVIGFRPIVTMLAILAGGQIFGVLGALLAVPVSLMITIIFQHIYSSQN